MHLVIVGNSVAAVNTAQTVLKAQPQAEITIFSEEPYYYYPRPRLWEFLSGKLPLEQLYFYPPDWYEQRGIRVQLGMPVAQIKPNEKLVCLNDGREIPYDRLLLANGGLSFIPPIENVGQTGVFSLRNVEDALAIRAYAAQCRSAVVIGGGLLGLESARGLKDLGLEVTVVEMATWLLPRQLDEQGAAILRQVLENMGIKTITGAVTQAIDGEKRATGILLKDGRRIRGELILVSAGVRSNTALAIAAGLQVNRGVIVNEHMQTSASDIYAAGDVIEFQQRCYGIIPAAIEQARVAGASLCGELEPVYQGTIPSNTLQVVGLSLTTVGATAAPDESYQEYRISDPARGLYKKLVVNKNKLVGAILMGFPKETARVAKMVREQEPLDRPVEEFLQLT